MPYAEFSDPQSLNLYSYVRNIPTRRFDADGHCPDACVIEGTVGAGTVIVVGAIATVTGVAAVASTPAGQRSFDTFTSATSASFSHSVSTIKGWFHKSNNTGQEQGRDAQGKFLPKQPGQAQPGAAAEKAGLDAVGATKNTKPIPGSNRIPDGKTGDGQYVEVKSGEYVGNTGQVREMGEAAVAATDKPLAVVTTNPNVKIASTVKENKNVEVKQLK